MQALLVEYNHVIPALASYRPDDAFDVCSLPGLENAKKNGRWDAAYDSPRRSAGRREGHNSHPSRRRADPGQCRAGQHTMEAGVASGDVVWRDDLPVRLGSLL